MQIVKTLERYHAAIIAWGNDIDLDETEIRRNAAACLGLLNHVEKGSYAESLIHSEVNRIAALRFDARIRRDNAWMKRIEAEEAKAKPITNG